MFLCEEKKPMKGYEEYDNAKSVEKIESFKFGRHEGLSAVEYKREGELANFGNYKVIIVLPEKEIYPDEYETMESKR